MEGWDEVMRVVILVENTAPEGLEREHGLSVYLEHRGRRILLDTGRTGRFARNAQVLGVDLTRVDTAALSHGHYDHGNGLDTFFELCPHVPVRARPAVFDPHFHGERDIGLKPELSERYRAHFLLEDGPSDLGDGIHLVPDGVDHEQSLVVEGPSGLVVFNSCSHAGAGYIAKDILERFPGKKIAAYVGGLHLMGSAGLDSLGAAPGIVKNLARWLLDELGVGALYTGHCTGHPAFDLLKEAGGDRVHPIQTGTTLTFS